MVGHGKKESYSRRFNTSGPRPFFEQIAAAVGGKFDGWECEISQS